MLLPNTKRKKALLIIDVQPAFLKTNGQTVAHRIVQLIKTVPYDAYVTSVFAAERGSLWDQQSDWILPKDNQTHVDQAIQSALTGKRVIQVRKSTRSIFRGEQDVRQWLVDRGIEEVHLVGAETNDCILASAYDAFDSGFAVYALEECCAAPSQKLHDAGTEQLRYHHMSNHRCLAPTIDIELA